MVFLKRTKWGLVVVVFLLSALLAGFFYFNYFNQETGLSPDQIKIIKTFGVPTQFSIAYLPAGDFTVEARFVREEKWFYPAVGLRLTFLSGRLVASDKLELTKKGQYEKTSLRPGDFSYQTTVADVRRLIGAAELAPMEVPGFFGDGVETYASRKGVFVFEGGYLTYMQTLD
jgi:hypothetical protein